MLPYIDFGWKVIPTYGLLGGIGFLLGMGLAMLRCKRFGLKADDCMYLYAFSALGAMVGAKLLYLLTVLPQFVADLSMLWEMPELFMAQYISGGMVFYGGLIGAVLVAILFARIFSWRLTDFFPVLIPVFPLVHAIGRLGCFSAGCCYGVPTSSPIGIAFTNSPVAPNGIPLVPVQLMEAAAELVLFVVLLLCSNRHMRPWKLLAVYLAGYAPIRFVLEYFRGDEARGSLWALSTSQWLSIGVLAAGILLFFYDVQRERKKVHK